MVISLIELIVSLFQPHEAILRQISTTQSRATVNTILIVAITLAIVLTALLDAALVVAAIALGRGRRWGRTLLLIGGILSLIQVIDADTWTFFILAPLVSAVTTSFSRPSSEFLRKRPIS